MRPNTILLVAWLAAAASAAAAEVTFKIATIAPDGTEWMEQMRAGAEHIAARTEGRVKFRFFPGGVMGNDKSVLRKVRIGQLHGGAVTGSGLGELFPDTAVYSLPFTFRTRAEVDYVRERMDSYMRHGLEEAGFVTLGFAETGFAYMMSNEPIRTAADLSGKKVWIPEGDRLSQTIFEALGVSPISLPVTDVLTGLQTGLVDTVGASPVATIALQWHTRVAYLTDVPLLYLYGGLLVDERAFSELRAEDRAVVSSVMADVAARLKRHTRESNEQALAALRSQGIEFVTPSDAALKELRSPVTEAVDRVAEQGLFSKKALETMRGYLEDYRRGARAVQ